VTSSPDPELQAAAEEELISATRLTWRELSGLTPWGDSFEGFGPAGGALLLERSYLWQAEPGGDILCEVCAYRTPATYAQGARVSCVIAKPSG